MSISRSRASRVFSVSFPEDLARQVDRIAKQESRNVSELFREAFRTYRLERVQRKLNMARQAAASRDPQRYPESDVERFVDEIRAQRQAQRKKGNA